MVDMGEKEYIGFREIDGDDSLPSMMAFISDQEYNGKKAVSSYCPVAGNQFASPPIHFMM